MDVYLDGIRIVATGEQVDGLWRMAWEQQRHPFTLTIGPLKLAGDAAFTEGNISLTNSLQHGGPAECTVKVVACGIPQWDGDDPC